VNELPDSRERAAAQAADDLVRLNAQVTAMRAVLVDLLQDVVRAELRLNASQATQLLEANEQLVLSALEAQVDAETAAGALDEAARSSGLDPLTELANRTLLLDRLAQAMAHASRYGHRTALLFLDLNNFKQINDTFGHAAGDRAIRLVADCLRSLVRGIDTVSRHGGDEFLILLAEISQAADAAVIAEKVNASLRSYSRIDDHLVHLSASIGISVYPDDGEDAKTLIDRADAAMYAAKRHEFGGFAFHAEQPPAGSDTPVLPDPASRQRVSHHQLAMAKYELKYAQLREANERLVIAALGAQELQAAAEQAWQQQHELLSALAQELGNPFAPIRIAAAALGSVRICEPLLPRAQAIIERHIDEVSRLASRLVDPTKIDERGLMPDRRLIDLASIIDDVVQACHLELSRRLQTLDVDVAMGPLEVQADRDLLVQALMNLLSNAMAYTHDGGEIRLSVEVANKALVLSLSDNGIGILPESLATMFDPFVRDPRAVSLNNDGLGLGLTAARAILEAHGGSIVATSAGRGQGSRFVVSLPVAIETGA
jgi:diguanylate cyclase (GGDEF)-like protein